MQTRKPVVVGQFYPARKEDCINEIDEHLQHRPLSQPLPDQIVAGIVPHAGWTFSGSLAAMVFSAIKQQYEKVHTFVIFGAAHSYFDTTPAVSEDLFWQTPLGPAKVDRELTDHLLDSKIVSADSSAHRNEHSIEVQVPFIQHLFPDAQILPIVVSPNPHAVSLGQAIGKIISTADKKIVCIGSTDLTHYGPRYGFEPMGTGPDATHWATTVNDRQFIDSALKMEPQTMLASAGENCNACGPGAAAATVAAAKVLGVTDGLLLAHTNSSEVMMRKMGTTSLESVGYAAIIF